MDINTVAKSYKFRIYPTVAQEEIFQKSFGSCRFVFNYFLDLRKKTYEETGETLNSYACSKLLTQLKKELLWLNEVPSSALIYTLRDLEDAYKNFFRRVKRGEKPGYPKFKSKYDNHKSFKVQAQNFEFRENAIKLPKAGWVKCVVSNSLLGRPLSITVSQTPSGKYYASINCADVAMVPFDTTGKIVGIHFGLKNWITTSDGQIFHNGKHYVKSQAKLARLQRQLSRKVKGSSNYEKARIQVAKLHEKIANQRKDAINKLTTLLVEEYDVICVENWEVNKMVKDRRFAKFISDASWSEVVRQLKYKCEWHGKLLVQPDKLFPATQTCSCCGFINEETKDVRKWKQTWVCPECGTEHDRDLNAAKNLYDECLRLIEA